MRPWHEQCEPAFLDILAFPVQISNDNFSESKNALVKFDESQNFRTCI